MLFPALRKLSGLCAATDPKNKRKITRDKKHENMFVKCTTGVIDEIPLTCRRVCIGQAWRCVNQRLREHKYTCAVSPAGHLAIHCSRCECRPVCEGTKIVGSGKDKDVREIVEASHIKDKAQDCISEASITLSERECDYRTRGYI